MEYNSSLPIYLQVANLIKRDIVTGKREHWGKASFRTGTGGVLHHQSEYGQPCIQRA